MYSYNAIVVAGYSVLTSAKNVFFLNSKMRPAVSCAVNFYNAVVVP
jgi:hypothetical protein